MNMLSEDQIYEMVKKWAEHSAVPFQNHRQEDVANSLRQSILMAFQIALPAVPDLNGVRVGYSWDGENNISVSVSPRDELTDDMLIVKIGGTDGGRYAGSL